MYLGLWNDPITGTTMLTMWAAELATAWSNTKPYFDVVFPYVVALSFLWAFIRLSYGHIANLIQLVFDEIRHVVQLQPTRKSLNLLGTIFLFILVCLFLLDASLEFLFGKTVATEQVAFYNNILRASLVFGFGVLFVVSVSVARD